MKENAGHIGGGGWVCLKKRCGCLANKGIIMGDMKATDAGSFAHLGYSFLLQ